MVLIHGGDTEGYRLEYGRNPLDFSSNCNPLGVPDGVRQAICDAVNRVDSYPDPLCRRLRTAIAREKGVTPQQVLCGNGAADLIYRLVWARKPESAVVITPTFAEYELALNLVGCRVRRRQLKPEEGFLLTEEVLSGIGPETGMLVLCNPNSPTGLTAAPALLRRILEACAKNGILLVVDECFNGFLAEPEEHTLRPYLAEYKNLLIIEAFTKLYAMAGVRLGYCLCSYEPLLEDMRNAGPPWAVSSLAQAAGIAALREKAYVLQARSLIRTEKLRLRDRLQAMGIEVLGSEANYIFFRTGIPHLAEHLCGKGILIRDCSNYPGLSTGYYRVSIRTHAENTWLLEALGELAAAAGC